MRRQGPYVVDGHLAEQGVHLLAHAAGSRLQHAPLRQHLPGLGHPALQHVAQHLRVSVG